MQKHQFAAGETIFAVGDDATQLFMVLSGQVEVTRGEFVSRVDEGQVFGEAALLDRPRSLDANAKSDCVLLSMTRDEMIDAFTSNPEQAVEIIDALFLKLADTTDELIGLKADLERGEADR